MQKSTALNWDDLRFALALSEAGSLARAAKTLGVDHTTVGRRVAAAEAALGATLFTRTSAGFLLTQEGQRLLGPMQSVEAAVHGVQRVAAARSSDLEGTVRVTSPETFGAAWLAPRLARFSAAHPGMTVELEASGQVRDLARAEADVAVRFFRSRPKSLVVRRVAEVGYALYASPAYLEARPFLGAADLRHHRLLALPRSPSSPEGEWFAALAEGARPAVVSELTLALHGAAVAGGGITVLPCWLGDADARLRRLPVAGAPVEIAWLTVHRDLRQTPRVRVLLDFLAATFRAERALLRGDGS